MGCNKYIRKSILDNQFIFSFLNTKTIVKVDKLKGLFCSVNRNITLCFLQININEVFGTGITTNCSTCRK